MGRHSSHESGSDSTTETLLSLSRDASHSPSVSTSDNFETCRNARYISSSSASASASACWTAEDIPIRQGSELISAPAPVSVNDEATRRLWCNEGLAVHSSVGEPRPTATGTAAGAGPSTSSSYSTSASAPVEVDSISSLLLNIENMAQSTVAGIDHVDAKSAESESADEHDEDDSEAESEDEL